jgi:hypothetical protein
MNQTAPRRPPVFLLAMTVLAIVSFGLGIVNQFGQQSIQTQRNSDRITADLKGCARGNVFRRQVIDIAKAGGQLDRDVLDVVFENVRDQDLVAVLNQKLEPTFGRYDEKVAAIKIVDCEKAIPGG